MIHEICTELQLALLAKGCRFPVLDREPTTTTTFGRERIVVEHDDGGDSFGPVLGQHKNPKQRMTRKVGAKATIYAQSPTAGALEFEHRRRAEHVLDLVLVCLDDVIRIRKNAWTPSGGKFVVPDDLAKSDAYAGAVYELKFSVDRAVNVQTWAGAARPEYALADGVFKGATKVSLKGGVDDDGDPSTPETACGA